MSIELWSAPHIHFAHVEDDVVVLDTETDCYHCLLDGSTWMTARADGSLLVADESAAEELETAGFGQRSRPSSSRPPIVMPRRELAASDSSFRWNTLLAAAALLEGTLAFRRRSLNQLIEPTTPAPSSPTVTDRRLADQVAFARTALPWVPLEGECLQRAYQIRRILAARGIGTTWIFAVRTWPFTAHCWLQVGDLVIGDTVERVSRYTPIMAA